MQLVVAFLLVAATAPQDDIAKLWPQGVDRPPGLKSYSKTDLNQRLVILNGFDHWSLKRLHEHDYSTNSPVSINPNSIAPWAVSGGMQGLKGWTSTGAVSIPDGKHVRYWVERIEAGASRPLPKISWRFPDGTVFTDILSHAGKVFEVRQLTRTAKGWIAATPYKVEGGPPGYHGPGKKCSECHDRAGDWEQYGSLIRGSDGIFSFPLLEGYDDDAKTITAGKWPLKHWNE